MSVRCTQCLQQIGQVRSARTRGLSAGGPTWAEKSFAQVLANPKKRQRFEMFVAQLDAQGALHVELCALKLEVARLQAAKKARQDAWDQSMFKVFLMLLGFL